MYKQYNTNNDKSVNKADIAIDFVGRLLFAKYLLPVSIITNREFINSFWTGDKDKKNRELLLRGHMT